MKKIFSALAELALQLAALVGAVMFLVYTLRSLKETIEQKCAGRGTPSE